MSDSLRTLQDCLYIAEATLYPPACKEKSNVYYKLAEVPSVARVLNGCAQLGHFKGKDCMGEMGHKDTGFPIETLGVIA